MWAMSTSLNSTINARVYTSYGINKSWNLLTKNNMTDTSNLNKLQLIEIIETLETMIVGNRRLITDLFEVNKWLTNKIEYLMKNR